jgi:hypothetical protein
VLSVEIIVPVLMVNFEQVIMIVVINKTFDNGDRCYWQNRILLFESINHLLTSKSEVGLPSLVPGTSTGK